MSEGPRDYRKRSRVARGAEELQAMRDRWSERNDRGCGKAVDVDVSDAAPFLAAMQGPREVL